ncbi:MAG: vitamin K epoxide reductase family protein [Anaerolineales bacterium]|nr:vitamin K epoxide reductase family protein [Anaerolineales bacterium]
MPQRRRVLLAGLAGAGCALTAWLLITRMTGAVLPYCTAESACDIVRSSQWSTLLGLPLAFWGFVSYLAIGLSAWFGTRASSGWKRLWALSLIALSVSLYMTWISATRIQAFCPYCLVSLGLVIAIFVVVALSRPQHLASRGWADWAVTSVLAVVIAGVLHLYYVGLPDRPLGENENPRLAALAEHLEDSGARFYGASWCPQCNRQKSLFRGSADRLPYIECSPQGRQGPASPACTAANIYNYPTWIIEGRRYGRVLTTDELAEYSGFEWEEE